MSVLGERLLLIHRALDAAGLPHAFGGAIALAYCIPEPRGTRDIDVNVFVDADRAGEVFACLPPAIAAGPADIERVERDGQVRLRWSDDEMPVDLFFDVHDYHRRVGARRVEVPFEGAVIPVLDCLSLTIFKALFNRTKDWADIEQVIEAHSIDPVEARVELEQLVGRDDPAAQRLASLLDPQARSSGA